MAKGRKTAALAALGLGAAALSGMLGKKGKKDEDKSKDTTADASAGMAKDRLGAAGLDRGSKDTTGDASAGMSKDRLANMKTPIRKAPRRAASPRVPGGRPMGVMRSESGVASAGDTGVATDRLTRDEDLAGPFRKGGKVKKYASGGSVSSASKRADGCATRGKTRGKMV